MFIYPGLAILFSNDFRSAIVVVTFKTEYYHNDTPPSHIYLVKFWLYFLFTKIIFIFGNNVYHSIGTYICISELKYINFHLSRVMLIVLWTASGRRRKLKPVNRECDCLILVQTWLCLEFTSSWINQIFRIFLSDLVTCRLFNLLILSNQNFPSNYVLYEWFFYLAWY